MPIVQEIKASNFRCLRDVSVTLADLSVLVGPNGAGKSALLEVLQFLGDTARADLAEAIGLRDGFERIFFRGSPEGAREIRLGVRGTITPYSSDTALDEYTLSFSPEQGIVSFFERKETFIFKRTQGVGRRIKVQGSKFEVEERGKKRREGDLKQGATALATLRKLGDEEGASQFNAMAELLEGLRVFDVDVAKARRPQQVPTDRSSQVTLASDAGNLAPFLIWLRAGHREIFENIESDLARIVPGLIGIHLRPLSGAAEGIVIELEERHLRGRTPLADASFGTVRALALLAMLHDPAPPRLSAVEEIDHGLHPYALDLIVDRLREASRRTQLLLATHSPALVNRLSAEEIIVCERDPETGASRIPAIDATLVREKEARSGLRLGELWFAGSLGGVP